MKLIKKLFSITLIEFLFFIWFAIIDTIGFAILSILIWGAFIIHYIILWFENPKASVFTKKKKSKPLWKKWWIWIIIISLFFSLLTPNSNNNKQEIIEATIPATIETEPIIVITEPIEETESFIIITEPAIIETMKTYVYITASGTKYHTANCRWGDIEITLEKAISQGYSPCEKCH